MKIPKHWPKPMPPLMRFFLFAEKVFKVRIIASILPFALPLSVAGLIVSRITEYKVFTRGVVFSLLWLAIAPYLITSAYRTIGVFFDENRDLFSFNDQSFYSFQKKMLQDIVSSKYLFLSVPITLISVYVALNSLFFGAPDLVQHWVTVTYGILFFIAGVGFWGIARWTFIINQICKQDFS